MLYCHTVGYFIGELDSFQVHLELFKQFLNQIMLFIWCNIVHICNGTSNGRFILLWSICYIYHNPFSNFIVALILSFASQSLTLPIARSNMPLIRYFLGTWGTYVIITAVLHSWYYAFYFSTKNTILKRYNRCLKKGIFQDIYDRSQQNCVVMFYITESTRCSLKLKDIWYDIDDMVDPKSRYITRLLSKHNTCSGNLLDKQGKPWKDWAKRKDAMMTLSCNRYECISSKHENK